MDTNFEQPKTGLGSAAETNRLLGREAFDTNTGAPVSPTVITSKNATDDLNKIKTQHADIVQGLSDQATKVSTANQTTLDKAAADKAAADKLLIDKQNADAKTAAVSGVRKGYQNGVTGQYDAENNFTPGRYDKLGNFTPNTDATEAENTAQTVQDELDAKNAEYEKTAKAVVDTINNINNGTIPLSPGEQAQVDGLKQQFQSLIDTQNLQNKTDVGLGNVRGYQKGAAEYDPSFQVRTIGAIITGGINKVADLNSKMATAVANLTQSFKDDDIANVKSAWEVYQGAAKDRIAALNKTITDTQKAIDDAQKARITASRDNAIAGLVSQGVTDPKQVLDYLNFDQSGKETGDFSIKEVTDALKALAPESDLDKLSGSTRDFFILKGHDQLPKDIASLPENQQLTAYLKQLKAATTVGSGGSKITLSDVKSLGLPISTVGMTQNDILDSLQDSNPPAWFIEKLQKDTQQTIVPDSPALKSSWEDFRQESIRKAEGTALKDSPNYTKAKQYFSSTYDGLDEDQLDQISQQVATYVNGGMSYKDAVAQTETDIGG